VSLILCHIVCLLLIIPNMATDGKFEAQRMYTYVHETDI
jgi:hypothetical protein